MAMQTQLLLTTLETAISAITPQIKSDWAWSPVQDFDTVRKVRSFRLEIERIEPVFHGDYRACSPLETQKLHLAVRVYYPSLKDRVLKSAMYSTDIEDLYNAISAADWRAADCTGFDFDSVSFYDADTDGARIMEFSFVTVIQA